jgi:hypothetical protein
MSDIIQILDHVAQGLDRRLEQWRGKPNIEAAIRAIIGGKQELEDTFFDLFNKRLSLADAEGEQLDQYGTIVGQERLNFNDEFYRILLIARIGINISNGEPERIISTLKLFTSANFIHYMNLRNAEIALGSDGQINPLTVEFLIGNLQRTVMGGVRVNYLCMYDPDEAFSFAGDNTKTIGMGFGTIADNTVGGKFGQLYTIKRNFSFNGNNTSDKGFGSIPDPLVGGVMIGA